MSKPVSEKPARERILLTAHDLFYRDGIRATGIDKIIAGSGVSKVTFYRHFPSKNDLILAFLVYRHRRWLDWFVDALQRHGGAGAGLTAVAAVMAEWFENPAFRGCAFINTAAELGEALPEALVICRRHKQEMTQVIAGLLPDGERQAACADAAALAIDGAIIRAQLEIGQDAGRGALAGLRLALSALERAAMNSTK